MLKCLKFYILFVDSFQELRKECGITVVQLCTDSHVSSRTYAKFAKKIPVRFECCFRLFIGCFKGASKEEIKEFLNKLVDVLYDYYSECDVKRMR